MRLKIRETWKRWPTIIGAMICASALLRCSEQRSLAEPERLASTQSALVALRANTLVQGNSGTGTWTGFTVTRPAGVVAGDLCLLGVSVGAGSADEVFEIEGQESGWTTIASALNPTVTHGTHALYKFMADDLAEEPTSYAFGLTTAGKAAYTFSCFSGVTSVGSTLDATPGTRITTTASTAITGASVTPANPNSTIVAMWAVRGTGTLTPSFGTAIGGNSKTVYLSGSGSDANLQMNYWTNATPGTAVTANATTASAYYSESLFFALNSDVTLPAVGALTASSPVWTAAGSVTLTLSSAADTGGSGLSRVEFWDAETDTLLATATASPWTMTWAFGTAQNGVHRFIARAVDKAGNYVDTPALVRTVDIIGTNEVVNVAADVYTRQYYLSADTVWNNTLLGSSACYPTPCPAPYKQELSFLRFSIPARGPIISATLKLFTASQATWSGPSSGAHDLVTMSSTGWSETTTTWNKKPQVDGETFATVHPTQESSWVNIDVTNYIQSGQVFAFATKTTSTDMWVFHSKENTVNHPQIVISYRGAICGDAVCNGSETASSCPGDCAVCGNGRCEVNEDESCPSDCTTGCTGAGGACAVCGDGVCEETESCGAGASQCSADCGSCPTCAAGIATVCFRPETATCSTDVASCCGNGACDSVLGETDVSCPADCGGSCGDGLCSALETCAGCPSDCPATGGCAAYCGDGFCNGTETTSTCLADCR